MKVSFDTLRAAYPYDPERGKTLRAPCTAKDGSPAFENQCAIRVGVALRATGVLPTGAISGVAQCWHGHKNQGHTLRAEELGKWLAKPSAFGTPTKWQGKDSLTGQIAWMNLQGKKGVVLMLNFWGRGNQGDHIDLWTGFGMLSGDVGYVLACKDVWFWELP